MIGVGEDDGRAGLLEGPLRDPPDGPSRADGHERRGLHGAVRRVQATASRLPVPARQREREGPGHSAILRHPSGHSGRVQDSPKTLKKLRVGVIYGGRSGEHEVSIASAAAVMANLDRARYEPVPIRIDRDGRWALADKPPTAASASEVIEQTRAEMKPLRAGREVHLLPRPSEETILAIDRTHGRADEEPRAIVTGVGIDVIFPVLHGPHGEDGTVQGLLELANVPYVGCGVLASSVGMDKALMKRVFGAAGLPQCAYDVVLRRRVLAEPEVVAGELMDRLGLPVFVKPANLGSSVGISKARTRGGTRRGARAGRRLRPQGGRGSGGAQRERDRGRGDRQRRPDRLGARRDHAVARVLRLRGEVPGRIEPPRDPGRRAGRHGRATAGDWPSMRSARSTARA